MGGNRPVLDGCSVNPSDFLTENSRATGHAVPLSRGLKPLALAMCIFFRTVPLASMGVVLALGKGSCNSGQRIISSLRDIYNPSVLQWQVTKYLGGAFKCFFESLFWGTPLRLWKNLGPVCFLDGWLLSGYYPPPTVDHCTPPRNVSLVRELDNCTKKCLFNGSWWLISPSNDLISLGGGRVALEDTRGNSRSDYKGRGVETATNCKTKSAEFVNKGIQKLWSFGALCLALFWKTLHLYCPSLCTS